MDFRSYVKEKLLKKTDRILEFGPLDRPLVTRTDYPDAFFADIRSTEEIKNMYKANEYLESTGISIPIDKIVDIDYVVTKSYTETFGGEKRKFDVLYLSHVIEHMPDIIGFFKDVKNILAKNGKIVIIYPDARYCFDHFRNGTTFIDAYEEHILPKSRFASMVFDFTYNVVAENDASIYWSGKSVYRKMPKNTFMNAINHYNDAKKGQTPDDMHFWPFSDYQFVKFLYDLERAGMNDYVITDFHQTQNNTQEFFIVLELKNKHRKNHIEYQDLFKKLDPIALQGEMRSRLQELQDGTERDSLNEELAKRNSEISLLKESIKNVKKELDEVYSSKRWKYSSVLADLKNKILKE